MDTSSLVHAVQELSAARTVEDIAAIVRVTARTLTGADGATFILKDGDQCYYMDEDAVGPLWKGRRFPAASCISGWSMQYRESAAIADIYQDPRIPHDAYRPTFVKSLVMVPIRSFDPLGAIGNYWQERHTASPEEIAMLQALADSTATAMENAYLHANMQRRVEQRTRELQLAREQAEKATAEKSRFLAAASHNLRQPAQTLSTIAGILERTADIDESRRHLESMRRAIGNMQSMLDALLDLHRLESGAIEPQLQDVALDDVLDDLAAEFDYLARSKSLSLDIARTAAAVHTDPKLLREILRNFISNAIKYTDTGGVRIEYRDDGHDIIVSVADTGPGIPAPMLSRVFEPFFREEDGSTNDGAQGLGLSIADQLARLLQHRMSVESQSGVGSRFWIALPRARASISMKPPAKTAASVRPVGGCILYVEDNPDVRDATTMLLGLEGYDVAAASNGKEALALIRACAIRPQIVISDFRLPAGETGDQVVHGVREALGRPIPALLLTGDTRETCLPSALASSVRVLHKPVDAESLLSEIARLLSGEGAPLEASSSVC